jgi:hypothetical protein
MPTVTVGQENKADIEIYYEDHGAGQPVVLPIECPTRTAWTPGTGSSPPFLATTERRG